MPRPLRLQVAGGLYHVTAKANTRRVAFENDAEREQFLVLLGEVVRRRSWSCRSYCLLSTHYHLLLLTPDPDLAAGIQFLNGRYAQWANWRREEEGHVFGGRYGARSVMSEGHALEVLRYIALNPVRAGVVRDPLDWAWSSLQPLLGRRTPESFLDLQPVLDEYGPNPVSARRRIRSFIWDGLAQDVA